MKLQGQPKALFARHRPVPLDLPPKPLLWPHRKALPLARCPSRRDSTVISAQASRMQTRLSPAGDYFRLSFPRTRQSRNAPLPVARQAKVLACCFPQIVILLFIFGNMSIFPYNLLPTGRHPGGKGKMAPPKQAHWKRGQMLAGCP